MSIMLAARASNWAVMAKDKAGERPGRGVSVKIAEYARRAGEYSIQDQQNQTCVMTVTEALWRFWQVNSTSRLKDGFVHAIRTF
jgi:hypothetical protein